MPRHSPEMPEKLAASAFDLFAQRGITPVSVEDIARHVGVTKGSFYSHYASKQEIVLAAAAHYYRGYQRRMNAEIAHLADPLERLRRALALAVRTCVMDERNRVFTSDIFALALHDAPTRLSWAQFYDTVRESFVGLVIAAKAAGQLPVEDPRAAVELMLAAIEGVKMRAGFEPHISGPDEQQQIVEGLLDFLRGACRTSTAA